MSEIPAHASMNSEMRSAADPLDRISLRGYVARVDIGAFQIERGKRQRVEFNLVAEVAPRGDADEDLDRILSYDRLIEAIRNELALERVNLLETLAERIANRILREPRAVRVSVRIEKLDRGPGALGVEIVRSRGRSCPRPAATSGIRAIRPTVIYLTETVVLSARPVAVIDRLEKIGRPPAIICVGLTGTAVPPSEDPLVCRRVGLLMIEQTAWRLSAHDPRFVVSDTRTEMDWALENGRIPIWAPSRMVLGAVRAPVVDWNDPLGFAVWFADEMDAVELLTVGVAPPADIGLPTRELAVESVE
ncbi:MAG: dihydroneopterin aldolase [Rhodobacter sp.]|nr:dihydroneopterin aldolase [Rhodobacter sp.]MCY4168851.1 dihydroneopterin aldolase [Rhodobacter sp.]MCY4241451.1 dihydroneopterin aldolase [Rhodobacter sp.]